MNIEHLNYLVEVSKTKSISIAAKNLNVTQSTISQAITSLEKELGVLLFNRSKQGSSLTFEGNKIIVIVKELLEKAQELKDESRSFTKENNGIIRIAAFTGLMDTIIRVFTKFKTLYPEVQIEITEQKSPDIINGILNKKIDIGIVNFYDYLQEQLKSVFIDYQFNSSIRLLVSKNSHLAFKKSISPEDLKNEKIVLYDEKFIHSFIEKFMGNVPYDLVFVTNNYDALRAAVSSNIAVTFMTENSNYDEVSILNGKNVPIPLISNIPTLQPFGVIRSKNKKLTNMNAHFISYLKEEFISLQSRF